MFDLLYLNRIRLLIQAAKNSDTLSFMTLRLVLIVKLVTQIANAERIPSTLLDHGANEGFRLSRSFGFRWL